MGDEGKARALLGFGREVIRAETLTMPGRINLFGLFAVFLLILGSGLLDLIQAVGRMISSTYESGLPSVLSFVWAFGALLLGCVLILVLADVATRARE